jgi:hypothetical protein
MASPRLGGGDVKPHCPLAVFPLRLACLFVSPLEERLHNCCVQFLVYHKPPFVLQPTVTSPAGQVVRRRMYHWIAS